VRPNRELLRRVAEDPVPERLQLDVGPARAGLGVRGRLLPGGARERGPSGLQRSGIGQAGQRHGVCVAVAARQGPLAVRRERAHWGPDRGPRGVGGLGRGHADDHERPIVEHDGTADRRGAAAQVPQPEWVRHDHGARARAGLGSRNQRPELGCHAQRAEEPVADVGGGDRCRAVRRGHELGAAVRVRQPRHRATFRGSPVLERGMRRRAEIALRARLVDLDEPIRVLERERAE
jgi:hypothetical protein